MTTNEQQTTTRVEETPPFENIPGDFPRLSPMSTVPGAQTKLMAELYQGKYYVAGDTPPARYDRWVYCEELVQAFTDKSLQSKTGKRAHMTENEILQHYYDRLLKTKWVTPAECRWIFQRVAVATGWTPIKVE
ncbi:hypothetical protein ACO0K3_02760 [Undibacterium sp. Rencai35W]|uniref:hypothetical protein n=1 Tax=Undibacterium sp. Rencai35W TaxID=3413046 RepID=UPI003BF1E758